jgi:hypothetical protein
VDLQPIIKFDIRGKTLCLYFALDPDEFKGTKYRVERSEIKKCEDVPCLYRIKDDTCEQNAMELIAKVAELFGLDRGRKKTENYFAPYEDTSVLVKKGLITEYIARERYNEFLRKSNKQQADKARQSAPQTVHEEPRVATVNFNDDDIEEVRSVDKATGKTIITRFNKSFTAKLSQASDELKSFYATLKNEILSYAKTKSTVWWNGDSIHTDNKTIAKFAIHDNVLCLYLALRPSDYLDSNYQVEQAEGKRYAHVPCMYRIKNARRERLAIDLIADLARKCNLMAEKQQNENYYLPYRSTDQLIQDGLIKQLDSE